MKSSSLTSRQEAFANAVASGKSQADAYRIAYSTEKSKPETIHSKASALMADGKVSARVAELRKPIAEKVGITLESHLQDLMRLRNMAAKEKQYSAAIAAEIARGKASGVHVEKTEQSINSNQGVLVAAPVMSPEEWAVAAAKQQAELQKGD